MLSVPKDTLQCSGCLGIKPVRLIAYQEHITDITRLQFVCGDCTSVLPGVFIFLTVVLDPNTGEAEV